MFRAKLWAWLLLLSVGSKPILATAPTDSLAGTPRSRHNLVAFPAFFYTPETGFGGGGGAVLTITPIDNPARDRPDVFAMTLLYTTKNQTIAAFAPEMGFHDGSCLARGSLSYVNYPNAFHGLGNDTEERDREEYTTEEFGFEGELSRRLHSSLRMGLRGIWQRVNMLEIAEGGLLDRATVEGAKGGITSGFGPVLEWDGRDHTLAPTRGVWFQAAVISHSSALGSDYDYTGYQIDVRQYISPRSGHVVALQCVNLNLCGTVPFTAAPRPGDYMRGILEERYADHSILISRAEYRFPLFGRISGALFLAGGTMAARLADQNTENVLVSGGAGLRFLLDPKDRVKARLDFGFSSEGSRVYVQVFEAF